MVFERGGTAMKKNLAIIICIVVIGLIVFDHGTREWVLGLLGIGGEKKGKGLEHALTKGSKVKMVSITRFDETYHVKGCEKTKGKPRVPMAINKAKEIYKPCPVCKPPK